MTSIDWLDLAGRIVQTAFYIVGGVIAVLTYGRAKKTILQPIRTEIFKVQLQELTAVLRLFVGQQEIELRDRFGFSQLEQANICALFDDYASLFFGIEVDASTRPYSLDLCPSSQLTGIYIEKYLTLADEHLRPEDREVSTTQEDPRALWSEHDCGHVRLPREYTEMVAKIEQALESPLLPRGAAELLEKLLEAANQNVALLGEVLTECAREMPEKYPTRELLLRASFGWIHQRYNDRFHKLYPEARAIIEYVRSYWEIDKLPEY